MSEAGDVDGTHGPHGSDEGPEVGSLGEEAARLLGALSGWARDQAGGAGEGLSDLAEHAAAGVRDLEDHLDDHLATGSPECTVCPVCRAVSAVRQLSPEVTTHLAAAAGSLAQAASALLGTADPRPREGRPRDGAPTPDVEHIDLHDDWPSER